MEHEQEQLASEPIMHSGLYYDPQNGTEIPFAYSVGPDKQAVIDIAALSSTVTDRERLPNHVIGIKNYLRLRGFTIKD